MNDVEGEGGHHGAVDGVRGLRQGRGRVSGGGEAALQKW